MNLSLPPKRLLRARNQKMIAGVCGGIAEFFNIDLTWIRLILASAAILMLLFGKFLFPLMMVLVIYAIAWLVIPLSSDKVSPNE